MRLLVGSFGDLHWSNPNGQWWVAYGRFWSLVFYSGRWLNFGVHIEPWVRHRGTGFGGPERYGPYIDLHLPWVCVSFGNWPVYAGNLEAQRNYARGGLE